MLLNHKTLKGMIFFFMYLKGSFGLAPPIASPEGTTAASFLVNGPGRGLETCRAV